MPDQSPTTIKTALINLIQTIPDFKTVVGYQALSVDFPNDGAYPIAAVSWGNSSDTPLPDRRAIIDSRLTIRVMSKAKRLDKTKKYDPKSDPEVTSEELIDLIRHKLYQNPRLPVKGISSCYYCLPADAVADAQGYMSTDVSIQDLHVIVKYEHMELIP